MNDGSDLDPEIRIFQRRLADGYAEHPALDGVALPEARRLAERVRAPFAEGGPAMSRTLELRAGSGDLAVRVRIHLPHATRDAAAGLVYLHGGGWRYFSVDSHDRLMREYAARAGIAVVGIDYALAPEAPYPFALRQVEAVLEWLADEASAVGIDPARLALGGDSAGANLALAAALRTRDATRRSAPRALLLNYGTFRRSTTSASHGLYGGTAYSLTSDEMAGFWRDYLGPSRDGEHDPLAEPLHAPVEALRGLPPCFLAIAECDVLRDDSIEMAERLALADVDVTARRYAGTTHSFLEAMSIAAVSRRALDESSAWLRRQIAVADPAGSP